MAKNQKDLAESLLVDESPGWLTGFLADEDEMDRRALWRLASWGFGSVGAVIIAIMAHQSGVGLRHEQIAAANLARQSQQLQSIAKTNENETRRLASAIDTLNSDRDRLFTRMTVLEQGLDSVTGSINRRKDAQNDLPKTSSQNDAALSSPQAMPASDNAPPSQATALPLAPAPAISSTVMTAAAALPAIPSDAPKTSDKLTAGTSKADILKADSSKTDSPKTDLPKTADSSATTSASSSSTSSSPTVASAAPADMVVAKTSTAKPPPGNTPSADIPAAKSPPDKSQPAQSTSTTTPPATDVATATPAPATEAATKPAIIARDLPSAKSDKPTKTASDTPAKSEPEHDAKLQTNKNAKIVVASLPAIADAEPTPPSPVSVPAAHTDFGVDLGSARSIKGLRTLWRGVLKSEAKELASLHPIMVLKERTNGQGMQLRLVAGPLVDAAAAAKICAVLSENGRTCETAVFDGQRLAMKEDARANDPDVTVKKPRSSHTSRHRHSRRAAHIEEPIPVPPPPLPPKPSTFSSFFSR